MAGTKAPAENGLDVDFRLERRDALAHALVLRHDMPWPAQRDAVDGRVIGELGCLRDTQSVGVTAPDGVERPLELAAAGRVPGVCKAMPDPRVEHDDRQIRR